jgi:hypothetical protein
MNEMAQGEARSAAIAHSYREFVGWLESDAAMANSGMAASLRAFSYAWAAGQVYQANLDTTEPTPEIATLRVPRDMLRLLLVGSRALLALASDTHTSLEQTEARDLGAVARLLWRALDLVENPT